MTRYLTRRYWNDCVGSVASCVAVYGQRAGNVCMRVLGPILFVACQIAILLILYFYFLHIFPYFAQDAGVKVNVPDICALIPQMVRLMILCRRPSSILASQYF